ncbi:hypothetical protein MBAV_005084 [Candidatus Magnetobacterium bavaricum]|uniref:Uncharacterized protein n=1 Tax=Candidatus Magnetobacterium bavaricum TaxID=29290 RepID=A0A0F3GPV6_9BACT|nr:hypothetical protein MBAV_005084 [Candidatus Magnetobacterium bavaricum]
MASSCPKTRRLSSASRFRSLSDSETDRVRTGILAIFATTFSTSSVSTVLWFPAESLTSAPVSSMTSMALSGRYRSFMYLADSSTALLIASSVKCTP